MVRGEWQIELPPSMRDPRDVLREEDGTDFSYMDYMSVSHHTPLPPEEEYPSLGEMYASSQPSSHDSRTKQGTRNKGKQAENFPALSSSEATSHILGNWAKVKNPGKQKQTSWKSSNAKANKGLNHTASSSNTWASAAPPAPPPPSPSKNIRDKPSHVESTPIPPTPPTVARDQRTHIGDRTADFGPTISEAVSTSQKSTGTTKPKKSIAKNARLPKGSSWESALLSTGVNRARNGKGKKISVAKLGPPPDSSNVDAKNTTQSLDGYKPIGKYHRDQTETTSSSSSAAIPPGFNPPAQYPSPVNDVNGFSTFQSDKKSPKVSAGWSTNKSSVNDTKTFSTSQSDMQSPKESADNGSRGWATVGGTRESRRQERPSHPITSTVSSSRQDEEYPALPVTSNASNKQKENREKAAVQDPFNLASHFAHLGVTPHSNQSINKNKPSKKNNKKSQVKQELQKLAFGS